MQKQYPDSYLREQRAERVSNSLGEDEMADVRKHMIFHGRVQGVGFRYTAKYLARSMNLTGYICYTGSIQDEGGQGEEK